MKILLSIIFKAIRKIYRLLWQFVYKPCALVKLYFNNAAIGKKLNVNGFINVEVTRRGKLTIGNNLSVNSGKKHNVIGRQQQTIFWVEGELAIGNNVGLSSTAIICNHRITIGDNVLIGGNCVIYDTDFHNTDSTVRNNKINDKKLAAYGEVSIKNNVFIGAHTTILKGVTIGENAIVGACSVVTKNIPENEIWAGNPAHFIKKL